MEDSHRMVLFLGEVLSFGLAITYADHTYHHYDGNIKFDDLRFIRMVSIVDANENNQLMRNRTIRWDESIDALAVRIASEDGYFPEKRNGGVSRFLSDLIRKEALTMKESGKVVALQNAPVVSLKYPKPKRKKSSG
jgi:hypothetical protein